MNQNKLSWPDVIDLAGLTSIGLYIFLCSIFVSGFAVKHFTLPCGIPLFVGEQCLFFNFVLLAIKLVITRGWRPWHLIWAAYALWILWATWCGLQFGTFLTLRHAALFYYAFFALLGYSFYNHRVLTFPLVCRSLLILLGLAIGLVLIAPYYCFSCVVLAIILSLRIHSKIIRWALVGSMVLWYLQFMFCGSRSHLAGSLAAIIFIVTILIWVIFDWKLRYRLALFTLFFLCIGLGVKCFSDPNSVKSMLIPAELQQDYHRYKDFIDDHKGNYVPPPFSVKLYDDNVNDRRARDRKIDFVSSSRVIQAASPVPARNASRELGSVYNNIMFRWFIWEDMWDDLVQAHSLWGVGFGKPQRSKSLEILNWGTSEWSRDGWIAPHNSFFHMIYRAGIIGVLVIIAIVVIFTQLLKVFIARRSLTGILLLSVLIYWLAMANFLVILELPYNAVLFWVIFGMTFAYAKGNEVYESR